MNDHNKEKDWIPVRMFESYHSAIDIRIDRLEPRTNMVKDFQTLRIMPRSKFE